MRNPDDDEFSSLVQSQAVIHRLLQILPRSQIPLGSLDGGVAQQEPNLLEVSTGFAAELGAGTTVMPNAA